MDLDRNRDVENLMHRLGIVKTNSERMNYFLTRDSYKRGSDQRNNGNGNKGYAYYMDYDSYNNQYNSGQNIYDTYSGMNLKSGRNFRGQIVCRLDNGNIKLTNRKVAEDDDWTQVCRNEFGTNTMVVDFQYDLVDIYQRNEIQELMDELGIDSNAQDMRYFVTWKNEKFETTSWDPDKTYFMEYPEEAPHNFIESYEGMYLSNGENLGDGRVLCYGDVDYFEILVRRGMLRELARK